MTFLQKIKYLVKKMQDESYQYHLAQDFDPKLSKKFSETSYKEGRKYWKIDRDGSGKYMVDSETEIIYGIKAYGQVHKGHVYGTLDTVDDYFWGDYHPKKASDGKKMLQLMNNKKRKQIPAKQVPKARTYKGSLIPND